MPSVYFIKTALRLCIGFSCTLLIACAGNPKPAGDHAAAEPTETRTVEETAEQLAWPYPDQERWVEEPVFNGTLHLVEAGREHRQTIVLIHGLGYRGVLDWQEVIPQLAKKYHVIAIDLPGFGGSEKHQVQYAPQKYSELVSWVVSEYAHGAVIVIGHSMGGAVSLRFAHSYPAQVSRLIMVDAAGILQRTVFIKYLAKVPVSYEWLAPYQKSIPGLDSLIRKMAGKADGWTRSMLVLMDRLPDVGQMMMSSDLAKEYLYKDNSTLNAALGLVYEDFSRAVHELEVATHVIWGDADTVAPVRTGKVLANVMPNAQLHIIQGAGHVPMTDNFDGFMQTLDASLEQAPVARQAQKQLSEVKRQPVISKTLNCAGKNNRTYTGHYRMVRMENCRGVVLRNLIAESIELHESEVTLENVEISSGDAGLTVYDSVVIATLLTVNARTGMKVDGSYLDIAGANFVVREEVVDVVGDSQLYFSLSETGQAKKEMSMHGVSLGATFELN